MTVQQLTIDFSKRTKLDDFKDWCAFRDVFSTTDIKQYGLDHYYHSSDVRARQLVREGFLEAIPDQEARDTGLVREGCKNIRFYRVAEKVSV